MPATATPRPLTRRSLPGQCAVCRTWSSARLCQDCLGRFAPLRPRCRQCGLALAHAVNRCGDCLREPPPFTRTWCAVDYGFPWDSLVADFKFRGRPELASPLAEMMLRAWQADEDAAPELLLPVPLAASRLAGRGYNQAWELARRLARALALPALAVGLQRIVETGPQAELARAQRMANLRSAFVVDPAARAQVSGRRLLLVDDVMTTGATARECASTLLAAGAARVDLWVLARTPADD